MLVKIANEFVLILIILSLNFVEKSCNKLFYKFVIFDINGIFKPTWESELIKILVNKPQHYLIVKS